MSPCRDLTSIRKRDGPSRAETRDEISLATTNTRRRQANSFRDFCGSQVRINRKARAGAVNGRAQFWVTNARVALPQTQTTGFLFPIRGGHQSRGSPKFTCSIDRGLEIVRPPQFHLSIPRTARADIHHPGRGNRSIRRFLPFS
jgi:hypothetical protein